MSGGGAGGSGQRGRGSVSLRFLGEDMCWGGGPPRSAGDVAGVVAGSDGARSTDELSAAASVAIQKGRHRCCTGVLVVVIGGMWHRG